MGSSEYEKRLVDGLAEVEIVDAHEHLPPEKEYLANEYAGLNFFAGYIPNDLYSAGLSLDVKSHMRDPGFRPVDDWWPEIAPYWEHVKHGSYAQAAVITARDLFGIEEINDETIHILAEKIIADNTPGLYERVLRGHCNIRVALTCHAHTRFQEDPLLRPVIMGLELTDWSWEGLSRFAGDEGIQLRTIEDLVEADRLRYHRLKREGAVGLKTESLRRSIRTAPEARRVFDQIHDTGQTDNPAPLTDYLFGKFLDCAATLELPVAVHAGVWRDFRELDPTYMIPWVMAYPDTRFDLFHLGIPYVRPAINMAKNFPNLYLNLCWCYVLSERITLQALEEILDMVPLNKVIAFGADYRVTMHKVYGHLVMARRTLARFFTRRIKDGTLTESQALKIAQQWLHDNPASLYNV